MKIKLEERIKQYRHIYELLNEFPLISKSKIANLLRINWITANNRLNEARRDQYIIGPETRKCSFANILEYVYFFNTEEPDITYMEFREDPRVVYNAQLYGFCNSLVISREEIQIDGEVLLNGSRSDYYIPFTPDHSFECALQNMQKKIEDFSPRNYTPQEIIKNHWGETVKWDEDDENIYRFLKYDLRKKKGSLITDQHISREKINYWLENLNKRCTIHTSFYPETLSEYQTYLSVFDTDYEDFVIEVFSELPASPSFFKVQEKLILMAYYPGKFMNDEFTHTKILSIPPLEMRLLKRGIVKKKKRAMIGRSKKKDL
jgi:hypothetical protein